MVLLHFYGFEQKYKCVHSPETKKSQILYFTTNYKPLLPFYRHHVVSILIKTKSTAVNIMPLMQFMTFQNNTSNSKITFWKFISKVFII